jgi:hypothetical protein
VPECGQRGSRRRVALSSKPLSRCPLLRPEQLAALSLMTPGRPRTWSAASGLAPNPVFATVVDPVVALRAE